MLVKTGQLTLKECESLRSEVSIELIPGTVSRKESVARGWYPHERPFKWPSPKVRRFRAIDLAVDRLACQQMRIPLVSAPETTAAQALIFQCRCAEIFVQDPELFNAHPKKPSYARIEELCYPWVEGENFRPVGLRPIDGGGKFFQAR